MEEDPEEDPREPTEEMEEDPGGPEETQNLKQEKCWVDHMKVSEMGSNVYDPRDGGVIDISSEHGPERSP
ncbi:hypothetical protein H5410_043027, partial [Solanum commersonii]